MAGKKQPREHKEPIVPDMIKKSEYVFEVAKQGKMNVPLRIFASEKLIQVLKRDRTLEQGMNVATLPGICTASFIMSDAHQGYGCPVGGVSAYDTKTGIISPGVIGFDINCGVRLLATNLKKEDVSEEQIKVLLKGLFKAIPSGVGKSTGLNLSKSEFDDVLKRGIDWGVDKGYATKEDKECCEGHGRLEESDPSKVTDKAKSRGKDQLGTLGSGNHFLEIQWVDKVFLENIADVFGLKEGQLVVLIHCGSRGIGHQVCSDYLRKMEDEFPELAASLPDRDLVYAPADSQLARDYFGAMCAAANFAWMNRQMITFRTREVFQKIMGDHVTLRLVYDVCHNIAKKEKHMVDGKMKEVYVHRKGATRAFPPGNPELPHVYQKTGQPILIPGSMGTSSYVLVGTEEAMKISFGSTPHGAGRVMSRTEATRTWTGDQIKKDLAKKHIFIEAASSRGVAEEAPGAYKDVDEVVRVADAVGIGKIVARLKPMGVVKG